MREEIAAVSGLSVVITALPAKRVKSVVEREHLNSFWATRY